MIDRDKLYIDGGWVASTGTSTIDVINSTTEEVMGRIPEGTKEDVDKAVAAAKATQAVIPAMKEKGVGAIINLGSISWHLGLPELVLYQTAKAAIEGMTRSLARELGPHGIRVTCVVPGNVRTPRQLKWYTPEGEAEIVNAQCLKGRLVPEDVAAMILFLASDDARLVTGHEYFVDAGWR